MKGFAFVLATLFTLQAFTPALCMGTCVMEATTSDDCCMVSEESCCMMEKTICGDTDEFSAKEDDQPLPCNSCNVPCCSAPLCCFYYQEVTKLDFSVAPVLLTGQFPSNNGIPNQGFRGDCFQPPEIICDLRIMIKDLQNVNL